MHSQFINYSKQGCPALLTRAEFFKGIMVQKKNANVDLCTLEKKGGLRSIHKIFRAAC